MNNIFVWDKSPVMKMIGKNNLTKFMGKPEVQEVIDVFRGLPEPHNTFYNLAFNHCIDLLFSLYTLGLIHGIRAERQRRKKGGIKL